TNLDLVTLLLDLVDEALGRAAGASRQLIKFVKDRPGHDFRYALDTSKLRDELGWQAQYSLEEGLRTTVAWYLANKHWRDAVNDASYREYYERQYAER
ncbi:MAG: GDP-mannose 4,6-dehydratase, partial [Rhodothermales bacterium]